MPATVKLPQKNAITRLDGYNTYDGPSKSAAKLTVASSRRLRRCVYTHENDNAEQDTWCSLLRDDEVLHMGFSGLHMFF